MTQGKSAGEPCGRPDGHSGPHRSKASLALKATDTHVRQQAWGADRREKRNAAKRAHYAANRDHSLTVAREWKAANPGRITLIEAKKRAGEKGVPFALTIDDLPVTPDTCPVLGIQIIRGGGRPTDNSPSLDRIFPERGYVPGNVRWISQRANTIKSNATADELVKVAQDSLLLRLRYKEAA